MDKNSNKISQVTPNPYLKQKTELIQLEDSFQIENESQAESELARSETTINDDELTRLNKNDLPQYVLQEVEKTIKKYNIPLSSRREKKNSNNKEKEKDKEETKISDTEIDRILNLIYSLTENEQYQKAIKLLDIIINDEPSPKYLLQRAECRRRMQQFIEAAEDLNLANQTCPNPQASISNKNYFFKIEHFYRDLQFKFW